MPDAEHSDSSRDELREQIARLEAENRRLRAELQFAELAAAEAESDDGLARRLVREADTYRLIFDNSPDELLFINRRGRVVDVNERVRDIFGLEPAEVIGKRVTYFARHAKLDPLRILELFHQVFASERPLRSLELECIHADGHTFWVEFHANLVRDRGRVTGILVNVRDITERKQADQQLEIFRSAVEVSTEAIGMATPEGRHWYQNRAYTALFGHVGDDPPASLFVDPRVGREVFARIRGGASWDGQVQMYGKDGAVLDIELHAYPIHDGAGELIGLAGMHSDITSRKRMENQLRESEQRFQRIFDAIPDMVSVHDRELNIVYSNWNGFGAVPPEQRATGTKCHQTYRGFAERCPDCEAHRVFETGQPVVFVKKIIEGTWADVRALPIFDDSGEVELMVEWVRDISDVKRSEEALRDSEQKFRAIFGAALDAVVVVDQRGRVTFWNSAAEQIFGHASNAVLGRDVHELLMPPAYRERFAAGFEQFRHTGDGPAIGTVLELSALHRDGTEFPVELALSSIPSGDGYWAAATIRDLRQRRRAEQERADLQRQVNRAQRMEAVGRLAGGVAHDFNNLLTSITGCITLAMLDISPNDPLHETMQEILDASRRAADLTRQLLAFGRKQVIEPRVVDCNALLRDLERLVGRLVNEDVQIRWDLSTDPVLVHVDPGQIEQVVINLAANARDAMPDGGTLTVRTGSAGLDGGRCCRCGESVVGEHVLLSISDTGHGMSAETAEQIFEPFFSTKEEGKGTGLGLATTFGIIHQHRGHIEVESEPGRGTTFSIYLPRATTAVADSRGAARTHDLPRGSETVLVVEDEPLVGKVAVRVLERQGYVVHLADSGGDALSLVESRGLRPDLLVTDIVMPLMDGRELAERLLGELPGLTVLYTSGYTEDIIGLHDMLQRGANFIGKPYTPVTLARKVRQVLDASRRGEG